jgi:hypothetical protein
MGDLKDIAVGGKFLAAILETTLLLMLQEKTPLLLSIHCRKH